MHKTFSKWYNQLENMCMLALAHSDYMCVCVQIHRYMCQKGQRHPGRHQQYHGHQGWEVIVTL